MIYSPSMDENSIFRLSVYLTGAIGKRLHFPPLSTIFTKKVPKNAKKLLFRRLRANKRASDRENRPKIGRYLNYQRRRKLLSSKFLKLPR